MVSIKYGQLSQQYSNVFDSTMLAHVTLTGQMVMLMLIESLYLLNIEVISSNTDSITVKCLRRDKDQIEAMVNQWCADTGFIMDYEYYSSIHYLNVNNYFHIETNGKIHGIGQFAEDGIRKSQDCSIIRDALFEYTKNGTPIEQTITDCQSIDSFVILQQVNGGALQYVNDTEYNHVGKVVRYYRSINAEYPILRAKPNKQGNNGKVPNSDNAKIVNDYPDDLPDDINYKYYIDEALKIMVRLDLITDKSNVFINALDDTLIFECKNNASNIKKLIDNDMIYPISFSKFLVRLNTTKAYLRKHGLLSYIPLIPVKKRIKK